MKQRPDSAVDILAADQRARAREAPQAVSKTNNGDRSSASTTMLDTPHYGSKEWFEKMFSPAPFGRDRWGHQWRAAQQYRYRRCLQMVACRLAEAPVQRILDIGCGLGDFTDRMHRVNAANRIWGMDISENAVTGAAKRFPHIAFARGTLPDITVDSRFDGIVSMDCIYYLDDAGRQKAFKEIFTRLKPGGWFFFTTPLGVSAGYFSESEALVLIRASGFRIVARSFIHSALYSRFERPLLRIRQRLSGGLSFYDRRRLPETPCQKAAVSLLRAPFFGGGAKGALRLSHIIISRLLSDEKMVAVSQNLSRHLLKDRGRSHLLVMARRND